MKKGELKRILLSYGVKVQHIMAVMELYDENDYLKGLVTELYQNKQIEDNL